MSLVEFLKGSYTEFKDKVEWPKWAELQSSTIVVSVTTVILALLTFGVDSFFSVTIKNFVATFINLFN
ncbi:preprotein translocase subunit SecE [Chryseobacterium sp. SC28]|uniref:preprotein translocase subunit SecE n=1 Tax=Chryseobacterium sp. SC28 TaxID=2268028 RepID=UPI000F650C97|nr:preprotein translocase subunit SecE [Chryseobacterium sp. SC28]MCG2792991.1 preprotein translocase subunit SecE [Weeksellaceae bacterium]RRQ45383.1 preprotein translocase subunit SecE [Chryseobacterium sp. SC28]